MFIEGSPCCLTNDRPMHDDQASSARVTLKQGIKTSSNSCGHNQVDHRFAGTYSSFTMSSSIIRSVASVILSLLVAMVLVIAVEGVSAVLHPFPPGFDGTPDEMYEHVARYPDWVLAAAVAGWGATTFASTWLATRVGAARHPAHGIVVGSLLLLAVVFNMYHLPYPLWFEVLNLVVFPLGIYYGVKLGREERNAKSVTDISTQ